MAKPASSRSLSAEKTEIRFAEPFRISGHVFEAMRSVVVRLRLGDHVGRGEAAGVYYLGDGQQQMLETIEEVRDTVEGGVDRAELQSLLPACGARNAIDCALWELESRKAGVAVWTLAGVPAPKALVTTFTLPAAEPAALAKKIEWLGPAKAIKLKLSGDIDADAERIAVVRHARPDAWLGVDANQGFERDDLEALARLVHDHRVSLVEQPLRRGDEPSLAGWRPGVPVAADESILGLEELSELGHHFDVINIKLDKCGGLTEALAMAWTARSMGKQVMVGNMGGSTLAMAPGFVVAQLCDFVDLDGPFGHGGDPLADEIYEDGRIFVKESLWGAGNSRPAASSRP
ncbi:MAG TPA: dipeptide epimerase [Sphingomicrobium sp.]|nr:dipeptide epimerase [Sphingomicrobium sp.]